MEEHQSQKKRQGLRLQGSSDSSVIDKKNFFAEIQKALYEELGGKRRETSDPPQTDDVRKFWSEIWDKPIQYKEYAEWLVKELKVLKIQNNVVITKECVINQVCKMPNQKSPGLDYIQGFWLKRLSSLHQLIADFLNNELQSASIPEWMVEIHTSYAKGSN